MRKWFPALLGFMLLPAVMKASDVWKGKAVEEWTREETQEFFRDSPWVHQIIVLASSVEVQPASYPGPTSEGQRQPSSVEGIEIEPRFGANGRVAETAYYIEWSSAKIVRRAGAHYRALAGQGREEKNPYTLDTYVVTVSGYDLAAFDGHSGTALKDASYLRPQESKTKVRPTQAEVLRDENGRVIAVRYSFPRQLEGQPLISDRQRSVKFVCKAGDLRLKTRFEISEMVVGTGRDL
jgi:hypothetical protein